MNAVASFVFISLVQKNHNASMLFKFRASQRWNNLLVSVTSAKNLSGFKTETFFSFD